MSLVALILRQPSLLRLHYVELITDALISLWAFLLLLLFIKLTRSRSERFMHVLLVVFGAFLAALGCTFFTFMLRIILPEKLWMLTAIAISQEIASMTGMLAVVLTIMHFPRMAKMRDPNVDGLTGLPNRMRFDEELEQALHREHIDRGYHIAVLFIDLDGFKRVNDDQGHNVGDELLRTVAKRLRSAVRPQDLVARYGGDEFTVLLKGVTDLKRAEEIAVRIIKNVQDSCMINNNAVRVGASIGIVMSSGTSNARQIIANADQMMYRAKTTNPGSYEIWSVGSDALQAR